MIEDKSEKNMNNKKSETLFNEDKLEMLLNDIYSEQIIPSQELVKITKVAVKKPGMLEHILSLSIILNFAATLLSVYIIIFKLHSILEKVFAVSILSIIANLVIIVIFLYRNDIRSLFQKVEI